MATSLKTRPHFGENRTVYGIDCREVTVTEANANAVNMWLRDSGELTWHHNNNVNSPKLRVKTRAGVRVAVNGDVIVKVGRWALGNVPDFFVVKG